MVRTHVASIQTRLVVSFIAIVVMATGVVWLWNRSEVFDYQLSEEYRLIIRQRASDSPDEIMLRITYHKPPAIGAIMIADQTIVRPATALTFTAVEDSDTGVKCVFDNNGVGFLLMYDPTSDDLWDSTGRSGGWHGTDPNIWQAQLTELHQKYPSIPYSVLPGEVNNRKTN